MLAKRDEQGQGTTDSRYEQTAIEVVVNPLLLLLWAGMNHLLY